MPHAEMFTLVWEGYFLALTYIEEGRRLFSLPAAVIEVHTDQVTKGCAKFEESSKQ